MLETPIRSDTIVAMSDKFMNWFRFFLPALTVLAFSACSQPGSDDTFLRVQLDPALGIDHIDVLKIQMRGVEDGTHAPEKKPYELDLSTWSFDSSPYIIKLVPKSLKGYVQAQVIAEVDGELVAATMVVFNISEGGVTDCLLKGSHTCDADGDGVPDCDITLCCPGLHPAHDCDDTNPDAHPIDYEDPCTECGNDIDEDCDGVDIECTDWNGDEIVDACQPCDPTIPDIGWGQPELCDGIDNDCNGLVDEGFDNVSCGVGACATTVSECVDGTPMLCAPTAPSDEICDSIDNDCDGLVDNDVTNQQQSGCPTSGVCLFQVDIRCVDGSWICDTSGVTFFEDEEVLCDGFDNDCDGDTDEELGQESCGVGACAKTIDLCQDGQPQTCDPMNGSSEEICDDIDNDCDDDTDEDLGATVCGVGQCDLPQAVCVYGQEVACNPILGASVEICDGNDNDCDGGVDEDLGDGTCGVGVCEHTVPTCVEGELNPCDPLEGATNESCDGLDNDCDGAIDEALGDTSCGVGACAQSVAACVNGQAQNCVPLTPTVETCDGFDNDCNGQTDEDSGTLICGQGACQVEVPACVGGNTQFCTPTSPTAETCDGVDNDCDGDVDEELGTITCGTGPCTNTVNICINGSEGNCTPLPGGSEICDGVDNDCDGFVDEELGTRNCGIGACLTVVDLCTGGQETPCPPPDPGTESCNGIDDDCNGDTDNGAGPTCPHGVCSDGACQEPECNDGVQNGAETGVDCGGGCVACGGSPTATGQLVINEIMKEPKAYWPWDEGTEWFELYNATLDITLNLHNCSIRDNHDNYLVINKHIHVIPGGYALLAEDPNVAVPVQFDYNGNEFILDNGSDEIILDCNGVEIDRVQYNNTHFPHEKGKSLTLDSPSGNNNVGANWCKGKMNYDAYANRGTPGELNDPCN